MERDTPPSRSLWKGRSKRKHNRFDIEAYYRNKTKTFWFGPLTIGTKTERFILFQNYLKSNWNILAFVFSLKTKPEWNRVYFLPDRNVSIQLSFRGTKTELFYFQKIISKQNQNVLNCVRVFKRQNKTFTCSKKKLESTRTKAFGPFFLVLMENVLFRSRILFLKWIYSIFFGTKAKKQCFRSWKNVGLTLLVLHSSVGYIIAHYGRCSVAQLGQACPVPLVTD